MPTTIHESFGGSIAYEINKQLDTIRNGNGPAAKLARLIGCIESASMFLEDGARRDPDKQFAYLGTKYPGLVIEIAYSQTEKNLLRLADHYIVQSSGRIKMVIGIELDYKGTKSAKLMIWCPTYGEDAQGTYIESKEVLSEVCTLETSFILRTSIQLILKGVSTRGRSQRR